uniref:Putative ovule protein n=1 Tax=Solanum chacoense TaxID=4108 RepID=A0A0V0HAP3_SOLCH
MFHALCLLLFLLPFQLSNDSFSFTVLGVAQEVPNHLTYSTITSWKDHTEEEDDPCLSHLRTHITPADADNLPLSKIFRHQIIPLVASQVKKHTFANTLSIHIALQGKVSSSLPKSFS